MRLLLVGSDEIYALENFYRKYIGQQGVPVSQFSSQGYFYQYYDRSVINKLLFKAGLSTIIGKINQDLKKTVEEFNPDIVWVFKGMEITPECLTWIRERKILLVNYNPDNPFIFSGKGSGNKNVRLSIPLYHLHFTYNLETKAKLEKQYQAATAILPFGFDVSPEVYGACRDQQEVNKVCFLGNPDSHRAAMIRGLLEKGISIDVYGSNWDQFIQHENLAAKGQVYGDTFWKVLYRYRVQLNLLRIHNQHSHNMRTFEIAGIGGIQLASDSREHRMFFKEGEEIFLFSDVPGCAEHVVRLLSLTTGEATQIRHKARQRSLMSQYSYKDRAREAVQCLEKLYAKTRDHSF
jgi:spore maturation protein CgeB